MGFYEESIKRPFTNLKRLLAGILWNIIPIVNFIASGYAFRCAKLSMKNNFEMPAWNEKGELFLNGLKAFLVSIIYLLPVMILSMILFFSFILSIDLIRYKEDPSYIIDLIKPIILNNLFLFIALFLLFLLTIYITPSAVMNFVNKDKFNEAFNFKTVFKKAFTGKYLEVSVLMFIYAFLIYFLLNFIPLIGGIIASFLVQVTLYSAYGAVYNKL